jgi:hypothetical protein
MKTILSILVFFFVLASSSWATDPGEYIACMEYMTTNIPNARAPIDFALQYGDKGLEIIWNIKSMPKPTFAELDAIKTKALAWKSNEVTQAAAKIAITPGVQALMDAMNKRLPATNRISEAELFSATTNRASKMAVSP